MPDIEGHTQPTWQQVVDREYEPWKPGLVVDTARLSVEACVTAIRQVLEAR